MIIDFYRGNGGGGSGSGSTTDNVMRSSGYTQSELSGNTLIFKNLNGGVRDEISLSGITPDLSDYYTKEEIDAGTSGITEAVSVLAVASQQHTEAIGGLQTAVSANTAAIAELSGSTGGDATELQPVSALPSSGEAGTLIALNKPVSYDWQSLTSQAQATWSKIRGLCSENTWFSVMFGENLWYRIGSYNENDGWLYMGYYMLEGFTLTWDGNNFTGDNGNGLYVTGTTDGTTWEIDFSEPTKEFGADWEIPENDEVYMTIPAEIGVYQANASGTYETIIPEASEKTNILQAFPYALGAYTYKQGDVISLSDGRVAYVNSDGVGLNDFKTVAWSTDLDSINSRIDNLPYDRLNPMSGTPTPVNSGMVIAVANSGETSVKQALGNSGYTYVASYSYATGFYGVEFNPSDNMQSAFGIGFNGEEDTNFNIVWNGSEWDTTGFDMSDWTFYTIDTNTWSATNGNYTLNAYFDNGVGYLDWNAPVVSWYGGSGFYGMRVPQTIYQNAVMSQDVMKIKKMTAADYALITPDSSTLYIII